MRRRVFNTDHYKHEVKTNNVKIAPDSLCFRQIYVFSACLTDEIYYWVHENTLPGWTSVFGSYPRDWITAPPPPPFFYWCTANREIYPETNNVFKKDRLQSRWPKWPTLACVWIPCLCRKIWFVTELSAIHYCKSTNVLYCRRPLHSSDWISLYFGLLCWSVFRM